jgi:GDP-4-dehydro-6-deoxy-D-mannose reductase
MKVLMTGCGGFVAPYIIAALRAVYGQSIEIIGTSQHAKDIAGTDVLDVLDITDPSDVNRIVAAYRPDHFIHLAGVSHIPSADADNNQAWITNVIGTLNCAKAVLRFNADACFIFASSGQVYGDGLEVQRAHTEHDVLNPLNEYGVTKAAADLALGALAAQGLRVIRLRLYNHTGPGQSEAFAVPNFAAQIARIERGEASPVISVGNLEAQRDFLDVRDVAEVYARTVLKAKEISPGTIMNVCSGRPVKMRAVLEMLVSLAHRQITIEIDPNRWRKADLSISYGDPTRCRKLLDWLPRYSLQQTLQDVLNLYRNP